MITEKEVPDILEKELPEINIELEKNNENILKILQSFTSYTKRCAETGNIDKLRLCFVIAAKLIREGNNALKSAMENIYVFAVSSLIEIVSPIQRQIKNLLPDTLKNACLKHLDEFYFHDDCKDENCLFPNEIEGLQNKYYIPFSA